MISLNELLRLPAPLVLASRSPRRQLLLRQIGFEFSIVDPAVDEDSVPTNLPFAEYVERLALMKARAGASMITTPSIVIGSDTTVVYDNEVLNKPRDAEHAVEMLQLLSGQTHTVYTGLALVFDGIEETTYSRSTEVTFRELTTDEIYAYVEGGSPLDKAGAYGIQDDLGAVFVRRVEGCYYTIVGLPLELLYTSLRELAARVRERR